MCGGRETEGISAIDALRVGIFFARGECGGKVLHSGRGGITLRSVSADVSVMVLKPCEEFRWKAR